jgi:hypothetical protein
MRFGQTFLSSLIGIVGMGATFFSPLQLGAVSLLPSRWFNATSPDGELSNVWTIPTFSAVDQHGKRVTDRSARHVWVALFLFTRCPCMLEMAPPIISVQQNISHPDVRLFLLLSILSMTRQRCSSSMRDLKEMRLAGYCSILMKDIIPVATSRGRGPSTVNQDSRINPATFWWTSEQGARYV